MPVLPGKEAGKMRIKFTKGMTPESIADYFLQIVSERGNLIGAVNIYVQEYDEDLKQIEDTGYYEIRPTEHGLNNYKEYEAYTRRSKLKIV